MTRIIVLASLMSLVSDAVARLQDAVPAPRGPYELQVSEHLAQLASPSETLRAGAAESLGFLRAYTAETSLVEHLADKSTMVRRQAALALGWWGGRACIRPLLDALGDRDWVTRQAAHVSLTNVTGMEFPFDASAPPAQRSEQSYVWRSWWNSVVEGETPAKIVELLPGATPWRSGYAAAASSTYRGPPEVVLDGSIGPQYWQTKNVAFPQSLTIDLRRPEEVTEVVVHQYSPSFVMTDYELALSIDGTEFDTVHRATTPRMV